LQRSIDLSIITILKSQKAMKAIRRSYQLRATKLYTFFQVFELFKYLFISY